MKPVGTIRKTIDKTMNNFFNNIEELGIRTAYVIKK